jgi:hypothetical protein
MIARGQELSLTPPPSVKFQYKHRAGNANGRG